jgi:hypothetical protein
MFTTIDRTFIKSKFTELPGNSVKLIFISPYRWKISNEQVNYSSSANSSFQPSSQKDHHYLLIQILDKFLGSLVNRETLPEIKPNNCGGSWTEEYTT